MDGPPADPRAWRAVHALVLVVVVIAFGMSVRAILNPLVLFLLFLLLAAPFRGTRSYPGMVAASALLLLLWLLTTLGSLLAPFFLALGLAYVLYPVVRRVERGRVTRGPAIALLSLPVLAGIALALFLGVPALARQTAEFVAGIPAALQSVVGWAERMQLELARRDWAYLDERALLDRLRSIQPEAVIAYLQARQAEIARQAWAAVMGAGRGLGFVLTLVGYLFLTPILTFYLLRDWERITTNLAELVPGVSRPRVVAFFREYDRLLAGYLRGTLVQSSIIGSLTALGLWVTGIPYSLLLGLMAAVFNIIPYLGLVLTLIPALIVALFTGNVLLSLVKVLGVFAVVQALDGAVIGPRVVGGSVGLHPVWVILALSVAGFFWGFLGLLLAVPLAVLLKLLLAVALARYRGSSVFQADGA
jgi:predicted PurR-regulated permease PerM